MSWVKGIGSQSYMRYKRFDLWGKKFIDDGL